MNVIPPLKKVTSHRKSMNARFHLVKGEMSMHGRGSVRCNESRRRLKKVSRSEDKESESEICLLKQTNEIRPVSDIESTSALTDRGEGGIQTE